MSIRSQRKDSSILAADSIIHRLNLPHLEENSTPLASDHRFNNRSCVRLDVGEIWLERVHARLHQALW